MQDDSNIGGHEQVRTQSLFSLLQFSESAPDIRPGTEYLDIRSSTPKYEYI